MERFHGLTWTRPRGMDRERAVKYLETTRKNIFEAAKGLSEARWNFKPSPDRWSVVVKLREGYWLRYCFERLRDYIERNPLHSSPESD